ncbi:MAG: TRAP transporter TatT component family protein [Treponema sp.]|jgi:predicted anti-sigma-YlaC factor YlaD|nr:TRAP transporter TatT component family protein [Treponema sp.]
MFLVNRFRALCAAGLLGLSLASCATLDVAYANVGLQGPAEQLPVSKFDKQNAAYQKAGRYYLRGRDKILAQLDKKYPGFRADILNGDGETIKPAVQRLQAKEVPSMYWAAAGWLSAFSLEPLNIDLMSTVSGAVALLERGAELDPDYSNGAIWDALCAYYAAAGDFGGDRERARYCFEQSLRASKGKSPGPYVTWAQSYCVPMQDLAGFEETLQKALSVKGGGLLSSRARKKARWLLENKENFFVIWD